MTGENGTYACRLRNSLHERYKYFAVNFAEESQLQTNIISIVVISVVVLIITIGTSIKFYHDKVRFVNQFFIIPVYTIINRYTFVFK